MDALKIIAVLALIGLIAFAIKSSRSGIGHFIGVTVIVLAGAYLITSIKPIIEYSLSLGGDYSQTIEIIIKSLGIAYITEFVSSICRDVNENGIALGAETIGKAEILIISFPLFRQLVEICTGLVG